ncbi:putative disease resistance protein-like isoform X2 [Capsicum annuum]|nr:putative disease resistance protein-like isoform X2 [Capsicum annuum]
MQCRAEVERRVCFFGWCPNLESRYLLSRRATKIALDVIELQTEGNNYVDFSYPVPPVEVEAIPNGVEEFESRKKKEEEVMEAWVAMDGIAGGVGLTLEGDDLLQRGDRLRSRLMYKDSRVLVILDDVWEVVDLKRLGIPSGSDHNYWCKVTLKTRLRDVCDAMEAQKIVEVGVLLKKKQVLLKAGNSVDDPSLLHIAKDVAEECKGLPFAIVTVAGALKRKTKPSWEDALKQLQKSAPRNIPGVLTNVYQPLKEDFFYGMGELNVLSMTGGTYMYSIQTFPASIQRLSNLRTLCLSDLTLDDISIIGELVTLEILSIRNSNLEELPVEIGKLTNLILLEFWNHLGELKKVLPGLLSRLELWNELEEFKRIPTGVWSEQGELKRISPGVLSRLVRLEELHVVGVRHCSYSTLRELESLSRLTVLTLDECSEDVIYSNLVLSSKLTRYILHVGGVGIEDSSMDNYSKIIALEVTETAPLGDWICHLLRKSELVHSTGKGSENVLTELQLDEFQNVEYLCLEECDSLTHSLNIYCQNNIPFPKLERLEVSECGGLHHFCNDTVEGIEFPKLRFINFKFLPEFQNFWPTANNSITDSNPLFHEKVSCPNLETLEITEADNISAPCSHQLPTAYFSKLEALAVGNCCKLRNLMSPSVARGLLNLQALDIRDCQSMEEVITEDEQQGEEIMTIEPLFPRLETLELILLPKLRHFFLTKRPLEFPFLRKVDIYDCPEMKMFVQQEGSVSTPSLGSVNDDDRVKVDLNKWIQERFNS